MKSVRRKIVSFMVFIAVIIVFGTMDSVQAQEMTENTDGQDIIDTNEQIRIDLEGKTVSILSEELDYTKAKIRDYEAFKAALEQFPYLKKVVLCESNLTNEQMEGLQKCYPDIKFVWTIKLRNYWKVRTDQVAFSTNKGDGPYLLNEDVAQLKYCTDMVALDLGHNGITDASFLEYMPNLRILILVDNRLTNLDEVAHCKKLVYIETFCNPIRDISGLTNLVNLIDINISYNRFTDITPILHKPRLERLFVTHCGLSTAQLDELKAEYPDIQIEHTVTQSIDAGWRKVDRYYAMRKMFKTNTVSDLFTTDTDWFEYYKDVFDLEFYVTAHPEVVEQVGNNPMDILYYFLDYGIAQGHRASKNFSVLAYKEKNGDLYDTCGEDLNAYFRHYMAYGYKEGRETE